MPSPARHPEIEIKLRAPELAVLHRRLKQLGARMVSARERESNTLYDTPARDLTRRGQLIRIRIEKPASGPLNSLTQRQSKVILTYKGPFRFSRRAKEGVRRSKLRRHFKVRTEAEVALAEAGPMDAVLRVLGLRPVFRYEKFRTTYTLPGLPGLRIELDETPLGNFLELEGPIAGIDRAARLLGYNRSEYVTSTYGSLYLAQCRRRGLKPGDMLFPPTKKLP